MEGDPVDTSIVTLDHVFHHYIRLTKKIRLLRISNSILDSSMPRGDVLLAQSADVPDANCLIQGGAGHEVFGRMELGAHHVVVVAGQDGDGISGLPIPDPNGLIIGGADDPRIFRMEERRPNVVQVTKQGENASTLLVVPDFDLVVISSGDENGLLGMEADASDRPVMLLELLDQYTHTKIP